MITLTIRDFIMNPYLILYFLKFIECLELWIYHVGHKVIVFYPLIPIECGYGMSVIFSHPNPTSERDIGYDDDNNNKINNNLKLKVMKAAPFTSELLFTYHCNN